MFAHGLPKNEGVRQQSKGENLLSNAADMCQTGWNGFLSDLGNVTSRTFTRARISSTGVTGKDDPQRTSRRQRDRGGAGPPLGCLSENLMAGMKNVTRFPAEGTLRRGLMPVMGDLADANILRSEASPSDSTNDNAPEERILISEVQHTPQPESHALLVDSLDPITFPIPASSNAKQ